MHATLRHYSSTPSVIAQAPLHHHTGTPPHCGPLVLVGSNLGCKHKKTVTESVMKSVIMLRTIVLTRLTP